VEFVVGASFPELKRWLGRASVGLHTMWNEHFGICIVEYMVSGSCLSSLSVLSIDRFSDAHASPPFTTLQAAGLIPLAHNSGGPRADIVQEGQTGFLAATPDEYAQALSRLFASGAAAEAERSAMRARARGAAGRFSDEVFLEAFGGLMRAFLGLGLGAGSGSIGRGQR
jgi:alpha-1,2-mannosyltransferase